MEGNNPNGSILYFQCCDGFKNDNFIKIYKN